MVETPLMQQYREIKARHQGAILLFRMGEFYEMFYDDAELGSRLLGLTLTSRNSGAAAAVPLAGVPVKAAGEYIRRLVEGGYRVALCEQVEDPKLAKGVVRREVVETISPGAVLSDDLLLERRNNFVCAIYAMNDEVGVAAADISTGTLRLHCCAREDLQAVMGRLDPREILVMRGGTVSATPATPAPEGVEGALLTEREEWEFDETMARDDLARLFGLVSLEGLGLTLDDNLAIRAAGALVRYLQELQPRGLRLARPIIERRSGIMVLDDMTRRNLELVESLRGDGSEGTLASVLDHTQTPMGARLLREWLLAPLTVRSVIEARHEGVSALMEDGLARDALRAALDGVRDIERLATKASLGRSTPRELGALGSSLQHLPDIHVVLTRVAPVGILADLVSEWDSCGTITEAITTTLVKRPPAVIGEDATIAAEVDSQLDELRLLRDGSKDAIARIQSDERARTGINSLKVGYNRVFGYFIEVTKSNLHLVPEEYQRRQTIANGERFVTPALKEYEERVLTASEDIETLERKLFEALRATTGAEFTRLQHAAGRIAVLDVLVSLAETAVRESYVRPTMHDGFDLQIAGGRHPVVERMMPREKFIPNDVTLSPDTRIIILTGPNMAGKSTILRQVGLIVLMAQMGSFVPARSAVLGITDRVFTRVGASDNLIRGQSTFMVEMAETSAILHNATARSLVLLDEIGRGTSTYDGVSIAWAVSEHLHDHVGCKTIFATHYHELTQLADELVSVRNYNVGVREVGEQILFLHRLQPGGADRSYGIDVGRLAGLPGLVIERAREILQLLEGEQLVPALQGKKAKEAMEPTGTSDQLGLFVTNDSPFLKELARLDINSLTPLEALTILGDLAKKARERA